MAISLFLNISSAFHIIIMMTIFLSGTSVHVFFFGNILSSIVAFKTWILPVTTIIIHRGCPRMQRVSLLMASAAPLLSMVDLGVGAGSGSFFQSARWRWPCNLLPQLLLLINGISIAA